MTIHRKQLFCSWNSSIYSGRVPAHAILWKLRGLKDGNRSYNTQDRDVSFSSQVWRLEHPRCAVLSQLWRHKLSSLYYSATSTTIHAKPAWSWTQTNTDRSQLSLLFPCIYVHACISSSISPIYFISTWYCFERLLFVIFRWTFLPNIFLLYVNTF